MLNILEEPITAIHLNWHTREGDTVKTRITINRWCTHGKITVAEQLLRPLQCGFQFCPLDGPLVCKTTKGHVCLSALSDPCFHFQRDTAVLSGYLGSSKSLKHKSSVYHSGNTHIIWNPAAVTAAVRVRLLGDSGGLSLIQLYCWSSFYPSDTFQNITHLLVSSQFTEHTQRQPGGKQKASLMSSKIQKVWTMKWQMI